MNLCTSGTLHCHLMGHSQASEPRVGQPGAHKINNQFKHTASDMAQCNYRKCLFLLCHQSQYQISVFSMEYSIHSPVVLSLLIKICIVMKFKSPPQLVQLGLIVQFWYSAVHQNTKCKTTICSQICKKKEEFVGLAGMCPCQKYIYIYIYSCVCIYIPIMHYMAFKAFFFTFKIQNDFQ